MFSEVSSSEFIYNNPFRSQKWNKKKAKSSQKPKWKYRKPLSFSGAVFFIIHLYFNWKTKETPSTTPSLSIYGWNAISQPSDGEFTVLFFRREKGK